MNQNSARLDLIAQYRLLHQRLPGYGASLTSIVRLTGLIGAFRCRSVLDFGCGKGKLVNALRATVEATVDGYDPAVDDFADASKLRERYDLVIANDVLEHLHPDDLVDELKQLRRLSRKCLFLNISCRSAVHVLPDGRNCHTIVLSPDEWIERIQAHLVDGKAGGCLPLVEFSESNQNLMVLVVNGIRRPLGASLAVSIRPEAGETAVEISAVKSKPETAISPPASYLNREALASARFLGEGIELGVAKGAFSEIILRNRRVTRLWGVDRWSDHHDTTEYFEASQRLAAVGRGRSVLLRMTFEEALAHFAPESLDFIYVDGYAHTGQEEGRTMEQWWPKLKPGGILAGHDYHPRWLPTMNAVDRFVERHGLSLQLTLPADEPGADPNPSWWVRKSKVTSHGSRDTGAQGGVDGRGRRSEIGDQKGERVEAMQTYEPAWRTGSPIGPGESVILVGNGPSMTLRGERGARIVAFDQVVRFNWYAIKGFEAMVGTKTTLWSTFGRGSRPRDEGEIPPRALYIHGDKPKRFEIPVPEAFGVARSFYDELRERLKARSRRDETGKKPLLPTSGLIVLLWLLEVHKIPHVTVVGFDHFSKTESGGHHYWVNQRFKQPPEHDGVAEAEWFAELVEAGRVSYLDREDGPVGASVVAVVSPDESDLEIP